VYFPMFDPATAFIRIHVYPLGHITNLRTT